MNKITKIGLLSLALCSLVVALNVKAATGDQKTTVSLVLNNGENTCELHDYTLGIKAVSLSDQLTDPDTDVVKCTFLNSNANTITLDMSDLVNTGDANRKIDDDNFSGSMAGITTNGTLNAPESTTISSFNIGNPYVVYTKDANSVGVWSGNLTIQGNIPGSTPAGTYSGSLDLTLQAGN